MECAVDFKKAVFFHKGIGLCGKDYSDHIKYFTLYINSRRALKQKIKTKRMFQAVAIALLKQHIEQNRLIFETDRIWKRDYKSKFQDYKVQSGYNVRWFIRKIQEKYRLKKTGKVLIGSYPYFYYDIRSKNIRIDGYKDKGKEWANIHSAIHELAHQYVIEKYGIHNHGKMWFKAYKMIYAQARAFIIK